MARSKSKPTPKRRRIVDDDGESTSVIANSLANREREALAVEILRRAPIADVEAAAAEGLRVNIKSWDRLDADVIKSSGVRHDVNAERCVQFGGHASLREMPPEFEGLGLVSVVSSSDFDILRNLHDVVKSRAPSLASWSGSPADPKRRAFGFLRGTMGFDPAVRSSLDISRPELDKDSQDAATERPMNERAIVVLKDEDVPNGVDGAITRLLDGMRPHAPLSVRRYLNFSRLVAVQPNLHFGQALLPPHVDHPQRDGFGIVIVTVAIRGSGTILLESFNDDGGGKNTAFHLPERSAYMLSGSVRNSCSHGVLADLGSEQRESLNLRLGLHGFEANEDPPTSEVKGCWEDDQKVGGYD